jgi:hypothetical protein
MPDTLSTVNHSAAAALPLTRTGDAAHVARTERAALMQTMHNVAECFDDLQRHRRRLLAVMPEMSEADRLQSQNLLELSESTLAGVIAGFCAAIKKEGV